MDVRGVFLLPNDDFLGLTTPKTTHEEQPDQVYHEIGHYLRLLLKGNPNIVGMLFVPDDCVLETSPIWERILMRRNRYITRAMASAYRGWIFGEMRNYDMPAKRLSHVPRLAYELQSAIEGHLFVRLSGWRLDFVMAVKEGRVGYGPVRLEVDRVMEEIKDGIETLPLVTPDLIAMTNDLLLSFRETDG